eukprot:TRINITY_DN16547_c0_g2_i1.p1 TRINITY_DN16547_c0_g2~~TRINITY_DN16547_c0_g2_i1.p1  ORF type:complete len:510 (-),score=43.09 TRINITY_DN16547_c0_g2_i1:108-1568(-)
MDTADDFAVASAPRKLPLPLLTKVLLGFGDGTQMIAVVVNGCYLNTYLLEICCLHPTNVAAIQLIQGIFDALNDPLVGVLSDRTHIRWGRRRPWLLFGAPFLALSYCGLWVVLPRGTPPFWKTLYYLLCNMGISVGSTAVAVQVGALVPELTDDYNERTTVSAFRVGLGNVTGMIAMVIHTGLLTVDRSANMHLLSGACLAFVMWALAWSLFFGIRENYVHQKSSESVRFVDDVKSALSNRAFQHLIVMYLCGPMAMVLVQTNLQLFCKYLLRAEHLVIFFALIVQGVALFMVPVWAFVGHYTSKRHVYMIGGVVLSIALCTFSIYPNVSMSFAMSFVAGTAAIVPYLVPHAMLPDVVEDDELRTGRRREGMFVGFFTVFMKLAVSIALTLTNLLLDWAGYVSPASTCGSGLTEEPDDQPLAVKTMIRCLIGPVPTCCVLVATAVAWHFPVTRESHASMVAKVAAARAAKVGAACSDASTPAGASD